MQAELTRRAAAFLKAYLGGDLQEVHVLGPAEPEPDPSAEPVWLDHWHYPPGVIGRDTDGGLIFGLALIAETITRDAGWSRGQLIWALGEWLSKPLEDAE